MMISATSFVPVVSQVALIDVGCRAVCATWPGRSYVFGSFVLQPERQLLANGERPVRIGGRALDLLTALVEQPGQVLSKQQLIASVWPGVFVDATNLKANIATLRRALGEEVHAPRFVATVVGRGYRFVAPVQLFEPQLAPEGPTASSVGDQIAAGGVYRSM